jgi:phospholipid/cholesterol/gamma-HCH transport system permease protein
MPHTTPSWHSAPQRLGSTFVEWLASWRRVFFFGALALVMVFSPATYDHTNRTTIARQIYVTTWQILPWFTLLSTLISLVLIRIVVVTAVNYGLSQYALEMVVRVLVLELIPLVAALFVTLRCALAVPPPVAGIHIPRNLGVLGGLETDRIRDELVPRVIAYAFSVLTMAMVSSLVALALAYLGVYGLNPWGLANYTRTVGQVFDPAVSMGFALKTLFFSLAVAVIPIAATLDAPSQHVEGIMPIQPGTVRLFLALVLIEGLSLAVKYI